jgi:hypothetical protein
MKFDKLFLIALFSSLFFVSCVKEDTPPFYTPNGNFDSGVLVLNEGSSISSISYISFDLNSSDNDIYKDVNGVNLGEYAQSIGINGDLAYIVVSGSNKIEIVNRYTMVRQSTISTGLYNPRYIAFANGKAYVTNHASYEVSLDDDYISVINLATNSQIKTISVPGGSAEKIIADGSKLYMAQGGLYTSGNKIVVIDSNSDSVLNSITVGDSPNSMEIENGYLWVLCGGNSRYSTPTSQNSGKLIKIDLSNNSVLALINFPYDSGGDTPLAVYPSNLVLYGTDKYFTIDNEIYKLKTTINENGSTSYSYPLVMSTSADELLGFAIKTNKIYVSDVKDYTQNGKVLVYSLGETPDSQSLGTLLTSKDIGGVAPNSFYFNQ